MSHALLFLAALLPFQDKEPITAGSTVAVSLAKSGLRKIDNHLKVPFYKVVRGDKFKVLKVGRRCFQVTTPDGKVTGWIPKSAVMHAKRYDLKEAKYKIDPENPESAKGIAGSEAAAAKGFTPEAEQKRRAGSAAIEAAYVQLDHVRSVMPRGDLSALLKKLEEFRRQGQLGEFAQ